MDKFLDKLCVLIIKAARFINMIYPVLLGIGMAYIIAIYVIGLFIFK